MSEPFDLAGKVVLVTGASRGVGAAIARAAAAKGAKVACAARSTRASPKRLPGTIDETVEAVIEAGGEAIAVPTDLTSADDIEAMVAAPVAGVGPPRRGGQQRGGDLRGRGGHPHETP